MNMNRGPVRPHINRIIKYRKMTCADFVASTGERRDTQRIIVGKHEGKTSVGSLDVDGVKLFKCTGVLISP